VDARADIYAVGAVAFHVLTGQKLFEAANDLDLTNQVLNAPPRRPAELMGDAVPAVLDELVMRCLAKDRELRPATVGELTAVFDRVLELHSWGPAQAATWWAEHMPAPPH
jgi:serine/threonine-protein kinase